MSHATLPHAICQMGCKTIIFRFEWENLLQPEGFFATILIFQKFYEREQYETECGWKKY